MEKSSEFLLLPKVGQTLDPMLLISQIESLRFDRKISVLSVYDAPAVFVGIWQVQQGSESESRTSSPGPD